MPAQIFVVSGASGSGKTTLVRALQANDPALRFSVSYTTRPSRPGEVHGQDYFFVSDEEFLQLIGCRPPGGICQTVWVLLRDFPGLDR